MKILIKVLVLLLMMQSCYSDLRPSLDDFSQSKIDAQFEKISRLKKQLGDKTISSSQLKKNIFQLKNIRDFSEFCLDSKEKLLQATNQSNSSMMAQKNIVNKYFQINQEEIFNINKEKSSCAILNHSVNDILDKTNILLETIKKTNKNPPIFELVADKNVWYLPIQSKELLKNFKLNQISEQELWNCFYVYIFSVFLSIFIVFFIRNLSHQIKKHYSKFILYQLNFYIPITLPLCSVFAYLYYINVEFGEQNNIILYFYYFLGFLALRMMFYLYLNIIHVVMNKFWKKQIYKAFELLNYGILIGFLVFNFITDFLIPNKLIIVLEQMVNLCLCLFFIFAWSNFYQKITDPKYFDAKANLFLSTIQFLFLIIIIVSYVIQMILSCLGYGENIVEFNLTMMLVGLLIVVFLDWLSLVKSFDLHLQSPDNRYGSKLRQLMGIKDNLRIKELFLLRFTIILCSGFLCISVLMKILDTSFEMQMRYQQWIYQGFYIGNMKFIPMHFFYALFVFSLIRILSCILINMISSNPNFYHDIDRRKTTIILLRYLFFTFAFIVSLAILGFGVNQLSLVIGAVTIGFGVALQSLILDFISGIILILYKPIYIGDYVLVSGVNSNTGPCLGYIQKIKLLSTEMISEQGFIVNIPNSFLLKNNILNYSGYNKTDKCYLNFKIINFHDIEIVKDIIYNRIKDMPLIIKKVPHSPEIDVTRYVDKDNQEYFIINLKFLLQHTKDKSLNIGELEHQILQDLRSHEIQQKNIKDG